ncbi:hypothetical protein C8Q80DRAFT_1187784 [Daedaleopsis nitida]|nr:hypothetical protein C8Q80DRAFT_1187784 [Daedaleopsis nitida]
MLSPDFMMPAHLQGMVNKIWKKHVPGHSSYDVHPATVVTQPESQKKLSFLDFPEEIQRVILVDDLENRKADLISVSTVCKTWCRITREHLFSTLRISNIGHLQELHKSSLRPTDFVQHLIITNCNLSARDLQVSLTQLPKLRELTMQHSTITEPVPPTTPSDISLIPLVSKIKIEGCDVVPSTLFHILNLFSHVDELRFKAKSPSASAKRTTATIEEYPALHTTFKTLSFTGIALPQVDVMLHNSCVKRTIESLSLDRCTASDAEEEVQLLGEVIRLASRSLKELRLFPHLFTRRNAKALTMWSEIYIKKCTSLNALEFVLPATTQPSYVPRSAENYLAALEHAPPSIKTIRLDMSLLSTQLPRLAVTDGPWAAVDEKIISPHAAGVQVVFSVKARTIQDVRKQVPNFSIAALQQRLQKCLPQAESQGRLNVSIRG